MKLCECGCGQAVKNRYAYQHQPRKKNTIQSILLKLVICEPAALETGCWEWPGSKNLNGYGASSLGGKNVYVHRIVYEHFVGPIPDGLEPDHLCRNRACANFEHLEPVTHQVNQMRGQNANRMKTHCKRGHPLSEGNLYLSPRGTRFCRECKKLNYRRRKEEGIGILR